MPTQTTQTDSKLLEKPDQPFLTSKHELGPMFTPRTIRCENSPSQTILTFEHDKATAIPQVVGCRQSS